MKFNQTILSHISAHLPEQYLSSDELEERLNPIYQRLRLPKGRLELMTGIKTRGFWPIGTRPSDLATQAAKNLFNEISIPKSEIDLLIHASVCRDFLEPSTASVIHQNLDLSSHTMIFDLSNACLGVLNSMVVAASMIETRQIQTALIVSGENSGPLLEQTIDFLNNDESISRKQIKKYIANLTIGSGATALLLCKEGLHAGPHAKLLGGSVATDSKANTLCQGDGNSNELMMQTDSEALLEAGVKLASQTWESCKRELNLSNKDIHWAIAHQVGIAHEQMTMNALGLNEVKTDRTYPHLGNTGSAALPLTYHQLAYQKKLIKNNELISFLGIGSGLASIMLGLEWKC